MPKLITRTNSSGETLQFLQYTLTELEAILDASERTPGSELARSKTTHVLQGISSKAVFELAAIWLREFNADPLTIGYWPDTQELWTKHVSRDAQEPWKRRIQAYNLSGADEFGPLFAAPGSREIDPLPLLKMLQSIMMDYPALRANVRDALQEAGYR